MTQQLLSALKKDKRRLKGKFKKGGRRDENQMNIHGYRELQQINYDLQYYK